MSGGLFGQIVIGPPGSGKTTYCAGMLEFLTGIGRKVCVVNLDPANEYLPYECAVNVSELISLEDVMDEFELGPNGGLIYCMEFLEKNLDWLKGKLDALRGSFLLFDCPGQAELYTHHQSMQNIFAQLQKWQYSVATVHLVDAHHCCDASKFISVLMLSLSTMINLGLPHVNILSKIDLVHQYGKLGVYDMIFFRFQYRIVSYKISISQRSDWTITPRLVTWTTWSTNLIKMHLPSITDA
jgi:GTPase SAR1 family protein